jgi:hypothetical protein
VAVELGEEGEVPGLLAVPESLDEKLGPVLGGIVV